MDLLEYEKRFQNYLLRQYEELYTLFNNLKLNVDISLKSYEVTKAILLRMKAFYNTQIKIKEFLNKRYVPAAADFFVENILFYLKLFIEKLNKPLGVHSEKQIKPKRGFMRPDISIWNDDKVIDTIECKTQLG